MPAIDYASIAISYQNGTFWAHTQKVQSFGRMVKPPLTLGSGERHSGGRRCQRLCVFSHAEARLISEEGHGSRWRKLAAPVYNEHSSNLAGTWNNQMAAISKT